MAETGVKRPERCYPTQRTNAMPQPYLPAFSSKRYSVGFQALGERPAFAEIIGRCVSIWSYVDNEIGGLFGILLGTDSEAAQRVFLVLRRWSNQQEALNAAAGGKLSGDEMALYQAVISDYKSLESERNALAHGCLGFARMMTACCCPHQGSTPRHLASRYSAETFKRDNTSRFPSGVKGSDYVYSLNELENLYNRMEKLWFDIFYFNGYLRDVTNYLRQAEFKKLLATRGIGN